jgi:heavy metal sensor kinase
VTGNLKKPRRLGTRLALSYVFLLVGAMVLFIGGTAAVLFLQMRAQLTHFAVEDIETVEGLLLFTADGQLKVRDDYHNHAESKQVLEHYLEVLTPEGTVLYRNDRLVNEALGGAPLPAEGIGGYSERSGTLRDGTRVVMVSRRHSLEGRPLLIRLAHSEEPVWRTLKEFLAAAALIFPLMMGAAAFAGHRMSQRILAPVERMASRAGEITASRLNERLPVNGTGDELDHLAEVFNQALTRLDDAFHQLKQFTSDASHDLRTPLAALRSIGEVGLARNGTREEFRELVGSMLEEVARLTRLIDELLLIARGDAGAIQLKYSRVNVLDLARETVALLEPLAEEKRQRLVVEGDEQATVQADAVFLRQALINVLDNAIKYSPPGATTRLRVEKKSPHSVTIAVRDAGPGIAAEHAARIFDRFYRVDQGRSRDAGGFGLGLSIAQWAVEAHGGQISMSSSEGQGSTFRIALPLEREPEGVE